MYAIRSYYASTVWTLTYREIKALPVQIPETEPGPVGDWKQHPEYAGTVASVDTRDFWREVDEFV